MTTRVVRLLCFAVALVMAALPTFAADNPGARVVRLSLAQGDVQIDRNLTGNQGEGWEQAINNMPVTAGARLYAAENSKAELEFEDGSSLRLVGPAQISMSQLSFAPDGSPVNQIEIDSGLVYVNARLNDHAAFRIEDPNGESFAITQPSHLRFKVEEQVALLSVIDGEVEALDNASNSKIHGGESYNYILGQPESAARLGRVPQENEDSWDQQRNQYDNQYAAAGAQSSNGDNPDAYGQADLGYYGTYQDVPGYGESWQPNGVGPDWDPFDNGAWSYYPDWGWTFVSAYPWGWCPFYYGNWFYVGGSGWHWHPGPHNGPGAGHGGGFHPQPLLASTPHGFNAPHPPTGSSHRTVAVAGSHLRVGPIGVTHASLTSATGSRASVSGSNPTSATAARSEGRSGPSSNFVHALPASNRATALIEGQRGAYYVTRPTAGRVAYDGHRPADSSGGFSRNSGEAPRAYSSGGSGAPVFTPRTYSAPTAPHASGGSFNGGGGGFHGGGSVSGGGGFHGSGGGRR